MIGAVVLAAGLSSRMGAFKPLLPLGGGTLIESTVRRLLEGGAARVMVVTGSRAREIERALVGIDVQFAHNAAFEQTQMFDSTKIGLRALGVCEEVFVLPADIPLFWPETLNALVQVRTLMGADAARPWIHGKNGHPLLLGPQAVKAVLTHNGKDGLKGVLRHLQVAPCDTADEGCLLDADTWQDYERLLAYRADNAPTDYEIETLHARFGSTDKIRRHCRAVAKKALTLSQRPACKHLDRRLITAAAYVHDAARAGSQHAAKITQALLSLGYTRMAEITATHMELPKTLWGIVSEATVLYLADKLVMEDKEVTLDERFSQSLRRCAGDGQALLAVENRKRAAQSVLDRINEVQG